MKTKSLSMSMFLILCAILFALHMLVSWLLAKHTHGDWDLQVWMNWLTLLRKYGLWETIRRFASVNYPPVTVVTLFLYQKFVTVHGQNIYNLHETYLTKLPILFLDWVTLLFLSAAMYRRPTWRYIVVLALILFNPAILILSGWWGQWDVALVAPMAASLMLAWKRPVWSGIAFAFALLVKQQAIILIPVLFIILVHQLFKDRSWKSAVRMLAGFAVPIAAVFLVLQIKGALWPMIRHSYLTSVGLFTWVSMHAFNIWYGAIGVAPQTNDNTVVFAGLTYRNLSILALGLVTLATLWLHWTSKVRDTSIVLTSGLVISLTFFVVSTEMHERYILPALFLACLLVYYSWRWLPIAIGLTITASLNLLAIITKLPILDYGVWVSHLNIILLIWTLVLAWKTYQTSRNSDAVPETL